MQCRPVSISLSKSLRGASRPVVWHLQIRRRSRGRMAVATLSSALVLQAAGMLWPAAYAKSLHPDFQLMRGELQQYGDWLVGCDNIAECAMIGFPSPLLAREVDPNIVDLALQISLSGADKDPPLVELVPFGATTARLVEQSSSRPYFLSVEYGVSALSPPHGFSRHSLSPFEADAVVAHLSADKALSGMTLLNDKVQVRFPHDDFVRAYRAMQSRRTQLLKQVADQAIDTLPGELPDGGTMPEPTTLERIAAVPVMVSGFVPIATENGCPNSISINLKRFQFQSDTYLWSYECAEEAASRKTFFAMSNGPAMLAEPLELTEPRDGKIAPGRLGLPASSVYFDWDFGILRHYDFIEGREDCGIFRSWGYTENGWQLLERREMPSCQGLNPSQWIRTHYTQTTGSGPDE